MKNNIDDVMKDFEDRSAERAAREREEYPEGQPAGQSRVLIGSVERFYDKISVVAISLTGDLKVGDIIEIENDEYAIRQRVGSMQIDGSNVQEASDGDSVGIKLFVTAPSGGSVYRIE
jgi:translation initiation factor IF-2